MATYLPENTYTLEEFIRAGRSVTISYDTMSFKERLSNGTEISILNVINDYMDELKRLAVNVQFDKNQYFKYRFKPKLLCHDVYGNPELYYIILLLNRVIDVKDFDFKQLKMIQVATLNRFLSTVYNAEKADILSYNSEKGTE